MARRVPPTIRLTAYGLGLMICSPAAVRALEKGGDYMPPGDPLREPLRSLVEKEQRVVLLGTFASSTSPPARSSPTSKRRS
jgi:hypothetical protein